MVTWRRYKTFGKANISTPRAVFSLDLVATAGNKGAWWAFNLGEANFELGG